MTVKPTVNWEAAYAELYSKVATMLIEQEIRDAPSMTYLIKWDHLRRPMPDPHCPY